MAFTKGLFIPATLGTIAVLGLIGCGTNNPGDANSRSGTGGTGTGATGMGGKGGTGTGTGAGTGGLVFDTTPLPGVNLMPNAEGFMKTGDNELGIQGAWYSFGCAGAVFEPKEGSRFDNPGRMCFKGTAPMVTDKDGDGNLDYSTIWGAGIGFDLCAESEEEAGDAGVTDAGVLPAKHPLSDCPYNPDLATKLIGVAVRVRGVVNAAELRVQFNEGDNVANSYYKVTPADVAAATVMKVEFEDPLVKTYYNPKLKPGDTDANNVLAIQFMIPTNNAAPVDWDFCVEAISAITAP
jgi:hypothetical protein